MAGRILIHDTIAANRIVLRCKLAAACYDVFQADNFLDFERFAATRSPDVMILDADEGRESCLSLCQKLSKSPLTRRTPILLLSSDFDSDARITFLRSGAWDVLPKPMHEDLLMASLRRLLRTGFREEELSARATRAEELGFMDAAVEFEMPGNVVIVGDSMGQAEAWKQAMATRSKHRLTVMAPDGALKTRRASNKPDAYVIAAQGNRMRECLRFLSELRCQSGDGATGSVLVLDKAGSETEAAFADAAMALDLGADEILLGGFDADELLCKLDTQIAAQRRAQRVHESLANGMQLAVRDPLTGLFNRRYVLHRLQRMMTDAMDTKKPLAVLALDLDRFKQVNDSYGHKAGDSVLVGVSQRISDCLRPSELLGRVGGEEFLIALPDTDAGDAHRRAEEIRRVVRTSPVTLPNKKGMVRVTTSIGVSVVEVANLHSLCSSDALIENADRALLSAKAEGRDQVTVSRPAA